MINNILGRIIINLGYLFGGSHMGWSSIVDKGIQGLYNIVGATEINSEDFTVFIQYISHDEQPYAVQMLLIAIALVTIFIMVFKEKKFNILSYTALGAISLTLVAASIIAGVTSIARYELAPLMLLIPLVGVAGAFLESNGKFLEFSRGIYYVGMIMAVSTTLLTNIGDCRQNPTFRMAGQSYESFRNRSYFGQGYDIAADEYFEIVSDAEMTKIGFMEKKQVDITLHYISLKTKFAK